LASFADRPAITLHVTLKRGKNAHHIIEATFKGLARCLRDAARVDGGGVPSTKGRPVSPSLSLAVLDTGMRQPPLGPEALEHVGARAELTADLQSDPLTPMPSC